MHKNEIDIITLGCSKNLVDAERLMHQLQGLGYTCVHDSENPQGEIAVINTCGFIGDAKEESINTILQFAERKTKRKLRKLYVMGCLSERYLHELEEEIPEVDKYFGKFNFMELVTELHTLRDLETQKFRSSDWHRMVTTPKHYAYLKISEGCNRMCSYCAIPLITGRHVSRPMEEILDEVRWLVSQGVKEFQVIAQDLSYYGIDLYKESKLAELISQMADIEGVEWIRLHYAYPTKFPYDILPVMREKKNVCKYLDIALQHISDNMLSLMRRHTTKAETYALLNRIREEVPGICLRTTLLLGHPGETEADVEELKQFVHDMRFDRLGAFAYSDEEGTYANKHYTDDIPQEVKQQRVDEIMSLQEGIAAELNAEKVGKQLRVIIDRIEDGYYVGRTEFDSPEVDQEVLIKAESTTLSIGEFYDVEITAAETFDLYAKLI